MHRHNIGSVHRVNSLLSLSHISELCSNNRSKQHAWCSFETSENCLTCPECRCLFIKINSPSSVSCIYPRVSSFQCSFGLCLAVENSKQRRRVHRDFEKAKAVYEARAKQHDTILDFMKDYLEETREAGEVRGVPVYSALNSALITSVYCSLLLRYPPTILR